MADAAVVNFKKADDYGTKIEFVPEVKIRAAIAESPWQEFADSAVITYFDNGAFIATAEVNGVEWPILTKSAEAPVFEVHGLYPAGENAAQIAQQTIEQIHKYGFINLDTNFGGSVGDEVEAWVNQFLPLDKQDEVQAQLLELALAPNRDVSKLPAAILEKLEQFREMLPVGWPLTFMFEKFVLNQRSKYVQHITGKRLLYARMGALDSDITDVWNNLAADFKEYIGANDALVAFWEKLNEQGSSGFDIMREVVGQFAFMQFAASHGSTGIQHVAVNADGEVVPSSLAPAEIGIQFADALNIQGVSIGLQLMTAANPLAWGGLLRDGNQHQLQGDSRMMLRKMLRTANSGPFINDIQTYKQRLETALADDHVMTISRATYPVEHEDNIVAYGEHDLVRLRNVYAKPLEINGEKYPSGRVEWIGGSATWSPLDLSARNFMLQGVKLLTDLAVSQHMSVQEYLIQLLPPQYHKYLQDSRNLSYLKDYAQNGQSAEWLKDVNDMWQLILQCIAQQFPHDDYLQDGCKLATDRLQSVLCEEAPADMQLYLDDPHGPAWQVIYKMFQQGMNPVDIENQLIKIYPQIVGRAQAILNLYFNHQDAGIGNDAEA